MFMPRMRSLLAPDSGDDYEAPYQRSPSSETPPPLPPLPSGRPIPLLYMNLGGTGDPSTPPVYDDAVSLTDSGPLYQPLVGSLSPDYDYPSTRRRDVQHH